MADISRIRVDSTTYDLKDARLPAPGADGTGLVSVNGEWAQTPGYGYSVTEDSFVLGEFTSTDFTQEGTEYTATIPLTSELMTLLQRMFINHEEFNVTIDGTTYNSVADQFTYTEDPSIYLQDVFRLEPNSAYTALGFFVPTVPSSARIYGSVTTYTQFDRRLLPPNENDLNIENGTGTMAVLVNDVDGNTASGNYATAEGLQTTASGDYAHAEGRNTTSSGDQSHAEGYNTIASQTSSHAEGWNTRAEGLYSHTEGNNTRSFGWAGHAEGYNTVSLASGSHSEGQSLSDYAGRVIIVTSAQNATEFTYEDSTTPSLDQSVVGLYFCLKANNYQYAFRIIGIDTSSHTIQISNGSHPALDHVEAILTDNIASSNGAHSEGEGSQALATASHAEGAGTIASIGYQHVQGKYNIEDTNGTYAHIVGNGTSNTSRSNAHTLDWNGNAWYAGTVSAGTVANPAPVTNANDLATKAYVDANAGGDSPVESGTGNGSVQTKAYTVDSTTYTQTASGQGAFAEGGNTTASGSNSHAEGIESKAHGIYSHAEGYQTQAGGTSHAEGSQSASGTVSHAEGMYTVADIYSHAEGRSVAARASSSGTSTDAGAHAEGVGMYYDLIPTSVYANGRCVFSSIPSAMGNTDCVALDVNTGRIYYVSNINLSTNQLYLSGSNESLITEVAVGHTLRFYPYCANGNGAHTEGYLCKALAQGTHAEGSHTKASGLGSHAEGEYTQASGRRSHAEGYYTIASGISQHVEGRYNVANANYSHITGVGTSEDNRSNGFTVDWNGNGQFKGSLTISNANVSTWTDNVVITYGDLKEKTKTTVLHEINASSEDGILVTEAGISFVGHALTWYDDQATEESFFMAYDIANLRERMYSYVLEYESAGAYSLTDTNLIPLTKVVNFYDSLGNLYLRLVFGNNEKTYIADTYGYCVLESEYPFPSGS